MSHRTRRLAGVRRMTLAGLMSLATLACLQSSAHAALPAQSTAASGGVTYEGCPPKYLCLYKGATWNNRSGKPTAKYYHCGPVNLSGWVTHHGSYIDNQTGTPTTTFWGGYNATGTKLRSFKPFSYDDDYDFYPVNSITVC